MRVPIQRQIGELVFSTGFYSAIKMNKPLAAPKSQQNPVFLGTDQNAEAVRNENQIAPFYDLGEWGARVQSGA